MRSHSFINILSFNDLFHVLLAAVFIPKKKKRKRDYNCHNLCILTPSSGIMQFGGCCPNASFTLVVLFCWRPCSQACNELMMSLIHQCAYHISSQSNMRQPAIISLFWLFLNNDLNVLLLPISKHTESIKSKSILCRKMAVVINS